jgi:hypothetical protein
VRIDTAELARMYERAYLDDMRALRNDSVDVYPRVSDYIGAIARALSMLGLRIAAGMLDGLYVSAGHWPSSGVLVVVPFGGQPARDVPIDAVLVGERLDTVQALGRQPPRPYLHIAARVELAQHGLTDQAGLRCVHARTVPQAAQHRVREALAGDPGEDPSLGRPVAAWDTTPVGAHA